ncbi:MAG: transposase [Clostridia bacterium]|nr:transposase [Clostridia bacterium]
MELPKRKPIRLKDYDYSTPGVYFVTVCTKNKINYFWHNVGASIARPQDIPLNENGKIVDKAINNIPKIYNNITVDHYVVMPNHIHLLLQIHSNKNGRPMVAPTIDRVIQQMKGYVTKQIGKLIWQKLFHDHIIRGEQDYKEIWAYIDTNPIRWKEDKFYIE